jgi:hypothetical protein
MIKIRWWSLLVAIIVAATTLRAEEINWQEAVARLARERTQAEACVRILKKYGDPAGIDGGSLTYANAKADYDGIIAGLTVALARGKQPKSLPDLEQRLRRGFDEREAFCKSVQPLVPQSSGQKGVIDEIVSGAVGPIIEAVKAIYLRSKDDDALTRKTIQTQLEATSWPAFASVPPSS